jgi:hypothetical protein
MFYAKGKVMETRTFKTKKDENVPVYGVWIKNGRRSFCYDIFDFDDNFKGVKVDDEIEVPVMLRANAADSSMRAFLNISSSAPVKVLTPQKG